MDPISEEKDPSAHDVHTRAFLGHYELIMNRRERILENPMLSAAPLDWYIAPGPFSRREDHTSILSLGQLLYVLQALEFRNGGKRIHVSWLDSQAKWEELLLYLMPGTADGVWRPKASNLYQSRLSRLSPVQELRDEARWHVPTSPLFLSVEEVVQELSFGAGPADRKSRRLEEFWQELMASPDWKEEGRDLALSSRQEGKVRLELQCDAPRLKKITQQGPENLSWRKYEEERKVLIRELSETLHAWLKEKEGKIVFRKNMKLDEMLSEGPEAMAAFAKKVFDICEQKARGLNSRYAS